MGNCGVYQRRELILGLNVSVEDLWWYVNELENALLLGVLHFVDSFLNLEVHEWWEVLTSNPCHVGCTKDSVLDLCIALTWLQTVQLFIESENLLTDLVLWEVHDIKDWEYSLFHGSIFTFSFWHATLTFTTIITCRAMNALVTFVLIENLDVDQSILNLLLVGLDTTVFYFKHLF